MSTERVVDGWRKGDMGRTQAKQDMRPSHPFDHLGSIVVPEGLGALLLRAVSERTELSAGGDTQEVDGTDVWRRESRQGSTVWESACLPSQLHHAAPPF